MKKLLFCLLFAIVAQTVFSQDTIGVYYLNNGKLTEIPPIKYVSTKTNTIGAALTMGIANSSAKCVFKDAASKNIVSNNAVFYMYFGKVEPSKLATLFMFTESWNSFVIAKFKQTKKERELQFAKINIYAGSTTGIAGEEVISKIDTIRAGKYKITTDFPVAGEYCFMYNGAMGSGAFFPVYDFSVK